MKRNLTKPFVALITTCLMLALAAPGLAQVQWRDRNYRGNGRVNVDRLIRQAENRSDQFVASLSQRNNRGFLERIFGDTERVGRLAARAHDLESQLNALREQSYRDGYNNDYRDRDNNNYGLRESVAAVMSTAEDVNRIMNYRRLNPVVERQWSMLKSDLNRLARVYNLRQLS
jgi:hypothetical protein